MQNQNKLKLNLTKPTKDILLPNEKIKKILTDNYYKKQMNSIDNIDVDINHLENIFVNEIYYTAMKIVPLLERKILYLSYIENVRLNDICRRLKLQKKEVISLRNKAITHFKNNLITLYKTQKINNGDANKWKLKKNTKNNTIINKSKNNSPIRVLYKKTGQPPEVKIIDNVLKLKKAIIKRKLEIIPYETVYIVCNNKKTVSNKIANIILTFNSIYGDLILVDINKTNREFKGLSQEDIIWYSQDLINKSSITNNSKTLTKPSVKNFIQFYEKDFERDNNRSINYKNNLLNSLATIELALIKLLKGGNKNE